MTHPCTVCAAATNTQLCTRCVGDLERAIGDFPALAHDLQAVATRQAAGPLGLGDAGRQWDGQPSDDSFGGHERWMYAPGAADMLWVARNTLGVWIRHLCRHGYGLPRFAARNEFHISADHRHVHRVATIEPGSMQAATAWLLRQIHLVRDDVDAAQAFDELTALHAHMSAAILGPRPAEAFYGLCDAPDVRVDLDDDGTLHPRVDKCGAQLFGTEDARVIDCPVCGATYTRAERDASMLADLINTLGTVRQVASTLTKLGRPVTIGQIDGWLRRRLIPVRGEDENRHRMVRVGDVLDQSQSVGKRGRKPGRHTAA